MLRTRVITGLILLAVILFAIFVLDTTWLGVFFGIVLMLAAWEWAALAGLRNSVWRYAYAVGVGAATLAVIRRETNTWRWPLFAWAYMTTIGYVGALLAYQLF